MEPTDITWPQAVPKKKTIKHSWDTVTPTNKLKHKKCKHCLCEKFHSDAWGHLIFINRFGEILMKTPSCVLPNTNLNT